MTEGRGWRGWAVFLAIMALVNLLVWFRHWPFWVW